MLASPEFLFRFEPDPVNVAADTPYKINDLELASRLSFFLWSTIPDEQLITLASAGKLKDPAVLEQQVKRMLLDPRAHMRCNVRGPVVVSAQSADDESGL